MALKKVYRCSRCGYEAEIYEGKGLFGQHITPVLCPECKAIRNIVVGGVIGDVAPSFSSETGRLCPRCGNDKITKWNGSTCPKCGGAMTPTDERDFWT